MKKMTQTSKNQGSGSVQIMKDPYLGGPITYGSSGSRSTTPLTRQSWHSPIKGHHFFLNPFHRGMIRGGYNKITVKRCTLKRRWATSNTASFSAQKLTNKKSSAHLQGEGAIPANFAYKKQGRGVRTSRTFFGANSVRQFFMIFFVTNLFWKNGRRTCTLDTGNKNRYFCHNLMTKTPRFNEKTGKF